MTKNVLWGVIVLLLCAMPLQAQDSKTGYQEALRRIEAARISGATELALRDLELEELPPEIGQLAKLEALFLSDNQLTSLPSEIGHLSNLIGLYIDHNRLTTLPPEIGQLGDLQYLIIEYNALTTLPPEIGQLSNLRVITADYNQLTSLPSEIGQLNLYTLYLSNNRLSTLPFEFEQLAPELLNLTDNPLPAEITPRFQAAGYEASDSIRAYLHNYRAMLIRQTIAAVAAGIGGIVALILAFRWQQQRRLSEPNEKKKRL